MARKKLIGRDEKVGLFLTPTERKLILEDLSYLDDELSDPISHTATSDPVMFTLDDWDALGGCIAAEANHTKNKALRKKLDALFSKIQDVLDAFSDEPPEVAESPATILFPVPFDEPGATSPHEPHSGDSKKGENRYAIRLTEKQRESIVQCTELSNGLRDKIRLTGRGVQTIDLNREELDELTGEVDYAIFEARSPHKQRLSTVYYNLDALENILYREEREEIERRLPRETDTIYQFKVTLMNIDPPIWRRFQVPDLTLGEIHDVLQVVMGWDNEHRHQFIVGEKLFGQTEDECDFDLEDEDGILLSQLFVGRKRPRMTYEYDFGDGWEHEVVLENVLKPEPKIKYPRCIDGARACPPEDCGGTWGYADMLAALADPKHPEHREMKEWVGSKFDPENFSVTKVNKELRKMF